MERESFEDEATAALMNEHFVLRQARPRGAARPRRDLHGGVPGDDRPGRLAAERLPDARAGAVLRRHLLPARGRATGMPSWRAGARGGRRGLGRAPRGDPRRRRPDRAAAPGRRARSSPSTSRSTPRVLDDAVAALRALLRPADGGFGGAPKFPPASAIEFLLRRGETRDDAAARCARWRPAGCTTRSAAASRATRSTRAGSSPTSRRCSTTTRCSRAPTCTAGR